MLGYDVVLHSFFHCCLGIPPHQPRSPQSRNLSKGWRSVEECLLPFWPCLFKFTVKTARIACWYTYSRYHLICSLLVKKKTWETRRWIETYWMVRPRLVELCFSLSRGTCRCRGLPEYLNLLPGLVSKEIPASSSLRMNSEFSDRLANRLVISFQRTESEGLDSPFIRASLRMPRFTCCWWN